MSKQYNLTWNKTGKTYDFTPIVEMCMNNSPFIPIMDKVIEIIGEEECSRAEAHQLCTMVWEKYKPKTSSSPQPTKPPVPTCPRCGSTAITAGARGVNGFLGFIGASKTVNRCANCGNTWTPKYK